MAAEILKQFMIQFGIDLDAQDERSFVEKISDLKNYVLGSFIGEIAGAAKDMISEQISSLDALYDTASAFNTAASSMQQFAHAASTAGRDAGEMTNIIQTLSSSAVEAARGWGSGAEQFAMVGLAARDAAGNIKSTEQLITDIKNKLDGKSRVQRATILEYLGLSEKDAVYFTDEIMNAYADISSVMNAFPYDVDKAASAANEYTASINRINNVFTILKQSVTADILPDLIESVDSMYAAIMSHSSDIQHYIRLVSDAIRRGFSAASRIVMQIISFGARILSGIRWLNDSLGGVPLKIAAIVAAVKILGAAWKASGVGLVVTMIAAAVAAIADDIEVWRSGGESLIDWGDALAAINETVPEILRVFDAIRGKLLESSSILRTAEQYFRGLSLKDSVSKIWSDFKWLVNNIKDIWSACVDYIKSSIAEALGDAPLIGRIFGVKKTLSVETAGITQKPVNAELYTGGSISGAPAAPSVNNSTTINVTSNAAAPSAVAAEIARRQQAIIDSSLQRYRRTR